MNLHNLSQHQAHGCNTQSTFQKSNGILVSGMQGTYTSYILWIEHANYKSHPNSSTLSKLATEFGYRYLKFIVP